MPMWMFFAPSFLPGWVYLEFLGVKFTQRKIESMKALMRGL